MRVPLPFKSPSAVLQYHVNPEHAAHHAAVKEVDDSLPPGVETAPGSRVQADGSETLPTSKPAP
ncbi:hypothetical protein HT031_005267 [Scenedesmus sp. PABB004]|nr:hypothetical protein HT031_005267 [Scenedesmus sp. PABB004]